MKKNFNISKPFLGNEEIINLKKIIESGWITFGPETKNLEDKVKKKIKTKHAIAVNSCTSGIIAALIAKGAKPGDEVVTPSNTFIGTIHSLYNLKLRIKLCDINRLTLSSNFKNIVQCCTRKTKFIIPMHFGGNPTDLKRIINFGKNKNIKIIDDAATALGAKIYNKYIGSFKDTTTVFSLHANKIITSGEGGIICTQNDKEASMIRKIINSGLYINSWKRHNEKKFSYVNSVYPGYKFNFNDILASIATVQFKKLNKILRNRKKLYTRYAYNFKKLINNKKIYLPLIEANNQSTYYCFQIILNSNKVKIRNKLAEFLLKNKIQTSVYYTPAHKHSFYKKKFEKFNKSLPNTNFVFNNSLALPLHNNLNIKDIDFISKLILKFFENEE